MTQVAQAAGRKYSFLPPVVPHHDESPAMPNTDPTISPDSKAIKKLEETLSRVKPWAMASLLWDRVLADQEQRQLGRNLEQSYRTMGTIGMWQKLHGTTPTRAVIEVGRKLEVLTEAEYHWLLREIGEGATAEAQGDTPSWDIAQGKLRFSGQVIRTIRVLKKPSNIQLVLDAFHRRGWPTRILNPLTCGQEQLHQAVRSLNHGLKAIRFHAQEGARAITWTRT